MPKNSKKKNMKKPQSNQIALFRGKQCITPPPYNANLTVPHKYRFQYLSSNAVQRIPISSSQLCSLTSMGTVTNSTVTQFFNTVKVRRIQMWGSNPTAQDSVNVGVNFAGSTLGVLGDDGLHQSMSSTLYPAMLDVVPPKMSQTAQWQPGSTANGNQTLFEIYSVCTGTGTATITIDVFVTLKVTPDSRTVNNSVTVASSTIGAVYYLALDNNATGSGANTIKADLFLPTTT